MPFQGGDRAAPLRRFEPLGVLQRPLAVDAAQVLRAARRHQVQVGERLLRHVAQPGEHLRLELADLPTGDDADLGAGEQPRERVGDLGWKRRFRRRERVVEVERDEGGQHGAPDVTGRIRRGSRRGP